MIKQDQITLTLPRKTIKSLDSMAQVKRLSREQLVLEMIQYFERREVVRNRIQEISSRKRANRTRLKMVLQELPDSKLSEKELDHDIQVAIKAVRKQSRSHAKSNHSRL